MFEEDDVQAQWRRVVGRRSFLKGVGLAGAAAVPGSALLATEATAQYISDSTDDEISHAAFLNAYLRSKGAEPVNLTEFRTLPSSKATGARQIGRLTNLQSLNVDTSWYVRYRSTQNRDLGASFAQAVSTRTCPHARSCDPRWTVTPAPWLRSTASPPIACSRANRRSSSTPSAGSRAKPTPLNGNSANTTPRL
jgi:hypothetical protein